METRARKASDDVFRVIRNFGPEMSLKRNGNRILLRSVTLCLKKRRNCFFLINNYYLLLWSIRICFWTKEAGWSTN